MVFIRQVFFTVHAGSLVMRSVNDHGDRVRNTLYLTLGAGFDYYFITASPAVFSLGLDGAVTLMPGIYGKDLGVDDPDDSFAIEVSLSPNIGSYYFISDRVAPYVSICPEFFNIKPFNNTDGSEYTYPAGKDFMDYWKLLFKVNVGIKFFLPEGFRFLSGRPKPFTDFYKMD